MQINVIIEVPEITLNTGFPIKTFGNDCATKALITIYYNACNCKKDGGRPSGVGMQVQTSNYLMVLRSKVVVLSDEEKASVTCQVWIKKMSVKRTFVGVERC